MVTERFSTAIICMDGRIQAPAHAFIQGETGTQYTDTITRPGVERQLDDMRTMDPDHPQVSALVEQLAISTINHSSEGIVIAKHEECLGNPITPTTDEEEKDRQLLRGATLIEAINEKHGVGDLPVFTIGIRRADSWLWVAEKTVFQPKTARAHESTQAQRVVRSQQQASS